MRRTEWVSVLSFLFIMGLLLIARARAERNFGFFTEREVIEHIAEVTDEHVDLVEEETGTDAAVGYIYHAIGVLWLDVWTSDGRYCLFEGDQFWFLDDERAATFLNKSPSELRKPFFYTFPQGLLVLLGISVIAVPYSIYSRSKDEKVQRDSMSPPDVR